MPNDFNGNDVPAPEKSTKRKSTTPKARKSTDVASDGAAKKTSAKTSASKPRIEPAAPKVQTPEVVATNLSTMPTPSPNNLHERIRARAYQIYIERGGQHGFDQADWLQAESEILARLTA